MESCLRTRKAFHWWTNGEVLRRINQHVLAIDWSRKEGDRITREVSKFLAYAADTMKTHRHEPMQMHRTGTHAPSQELTGRFTVIFHFSVSPIASSSLNKTEIKIF